MELNNTLPTVTNVFPIKMIQLKVPDPVELVNVLENGLKQYFMNVNVEWTRCPDLTQEPFNLAARGICGQTAFIELGDMSYLKPVPQMSKIYCMKKILTFLGREYNNSFIFGNGISKSPSNGKLSELIMNTSFSPTTSGLLMPQINKSYTVFLNEQGNCDLEHVMPHSIVCTQQGSFFLCEGLNTCVLRVYVNKYRSDIPSFPGFINSMQQVLQETFGVAGNLVVLGGISIMKNVLWSHKFVENFWELPYLVGERNNCMINMPEAIISTFNSSLTGVVPFSPGPSIKLHACQSNHMLHHHTSYEHYSITSESLNGAEYLGYFYPAEKLYRLDEPPSHCNSS